VEGQVSADPRGGADDDWTRPLVTHAGQHINTPKHPPDSPPNTKTPPKSTMTTESNSVSAPASNGTPKQPVVCVFCGASQGTSPVHMEAARALATALHKANTKLVYGGGTVGLMGEVARTLVSLSGPSAVHGIIPEPLVRFEQNHDPEDPGGAKGGFVALSGGYGTFEELMEVTTWNQLGIHSMPVIVFNIDNYWTGLIDWVKNAVSSGFIAPTNAGILVEALSAEEVMTCLTDYENAPGRFNLTWEQQ
jgi:predicted Rossmann-fold nucleotide-binding protein